jgi:glycerol uptake facilitator protein
VVSYLTGCGTAFRDQYGGLYLRVPILGPLIGGLVGGASHENGLQRFLPVGDSAADQKV